jgi:hypothetical protein
MPNSNIMSYAKQTGKSASKIEAIWDEAKIGADKAIGKKGPRYWAYVNGTVKKRLGLAESCTFKEFVDLSFGQGEITASNPAANLPVPTVAPDARGPEDNVPIGKPYGQEEYSAQKFAEFIAGIFAARDKAHELHLASHSYAQHVALNELYDALLAFADELTEMYQGKHGLVAIDIQADDCFRGVTDPNAFVGNLVDWLEGDGRSSIGTDSFIINKFEEMLGDIYRTKYKLNFLS